MVAYSFKRRFIVPIKVGLGLPILPGDEDPDAATLLIPKRQTIRAFGNRRHARPGDALQLYYAMRTKQCRKIADEDAECSGFEGVLLKWSDWRSFCTFDVEEREPGVWRRKGRTRPVKDLEAFARDDGFAGFEDMRAFWKSEHGPDTFEGALVKWEPPKVTEVKQ